MRRLVLLVVVSCAVSAGNVLAVYEVPSERRILWSAGLDQEGGIPIYKSVPCSGLDPTGATNNATQINNCISSAPPGTAVYIPPGTYAIDGNIKMKSNVVLRGAGISPPWLPLASAGTTTLSMNGGRIDFAGGSKAYSWSPGPGSGTDITAGYTKGSNSLTLSGAGGYSVGDYISIFQDNDPGVIDTRGYSWLGEDLDGSGGVHVKQQYAKITRINGNVITISRPIYYVTPSPTGFQIRRQTMGIVKAGVENIKLKGDGTNRRLIDIYFARHCWIKNVETYNTGGRSGESHITIMFSHGCEIRDSYIHHGGSYFSGANYGIDFYFWNSDHKVENNIVRETRHSIIFEGGGSGCAILYNYSNDGYEGEEPSYLAQDLTTNHGAHPHMNLWEGNIGSKIMGDFTQGSSSHNTLFRNWGRGYRDSPAFSSGIAGFVIGPFNRYYNLLGNVSGMPSWTSGTAIEDNATARKPVAFSFGRHTDGRYLDPQSYSTSLFHGNYDYVTDGVALWQGGFDRSLPDSMYYSSQPSWWCTEVPWPPIGPDVPSLTNDIPAKRRYDGAWCTRSTPPQASKIPKPPAIPKN